MGGKGRVLFSLVSLMGCFASANPVSYQPVQFLSPMNASQASLVKQLPDFTRGIPNTSPDVRFSSFDVKNTRLTFFKEIGDVLEAGVNPTAPIASDDRIQTDCAQNEADDLTQKMSPSCGLSSDSGALVQSARQTCREIAQPEVLFQSKVRDGKVPGIPSENDLKSIEDLIVVMGLPLSYVSFPGNILTPELRAQGRVILLKIRYETLHANLRDQMARLTMLQNQIRGRTGPSCALNAAVDDQLSRRLFELQQASLKLESIYQNGVAQAQNDDRQLISRGRVRAVLEYPALTDHERELVTMILAGVYWRARGGGLIVTGHTQEARQKFAAIPLQLLVRLNAGVALNNGALSGVGNSHYWALVLRGWGQFQDMGDSKGEDLYHDLVSMTDRGAYQVANPASAFKDAKFDSVMSKVGGLHLGPCYFFAKFAGHPDLADMGPRETIPKSTPTLDGQPNPYYSFVGSYTEWAELCGGASIGLGMAKTLLNGWPK